MQFGHAGACANADAETAEAKNKALRDAGAHVPKSFDELGTIIKYVCCLYPAFVTKDMRTVVQHLPFLKPLWKTE